MMMSSSSGRHDASSTDETTTRANNNPLLRRAAVVEKDGCKDITQLKTNANVTNSAKGEKRTTITIVKKCIAVLALAAVLSLPLFFASSAFAVESGGRMGGSYGRSEGSSSSRTTPAPTTMNDSFSRGFGRGFGTGYFTPRPFWGDSFGFGLGPFYQPFGGFWGGGGWGMPYFGGGVSVYSPLSGFFAFSTVSVILLVFFSALFSDGGGSSYYRSTTWTNGSNYRNEGVTFAKCSVAMNVPQRDDPNSILTALMRASKTARTESRAGMQYLVNQVALEILRRRRTIIAANTKRSYYKRLSPAEGEFNKNVIRERSKFEKELVSKYDGIDFARDVNVNVNIADPQEKADYYPAKATIAVVTILVLLEGDTKLPAIKSMSDVENALSIIAADVNEGERLLSAEVLWTPVDRGESLSEKEVFSDYPMLTTI